MVSSVLTPRTFVCHFVKDRHLLFKKTESKTDTEMKLGE